MDVMNPAQSRFFIVGCPRSGTTLLSVLLDRHSRLCVPPETGFYDEIAPRLSRAGEAKLLSLLRRWRRLPVLGLTAEQVRGRLGAEECTPANVLAVLLDLYAAGRQKARCGEKTPQHLLHVPAIFRDFPGAKILCIVRDGRDNALSLSAMPWWKGTLLGASRLWAKYARLAARFAADLPAQFLVLRLEDLITDPERTLSDVMMRLDETYEPGQLDTRIASGTVLPRSIDWKGQALEQIDPARAGLRRNEASGWRLAVAEALMSRELGLFGYERMSPPLTVARLIGLR